MFRQVPHSDRLALVSLSADAGQMALNERWRHLAEKRERCRIAPPRAPIPPARPGRTLL